MWNENICRRESSEINPERALNDTRDHHPDFINIKDTEELVEA